MKIFQSFLISRATKMGQRVKVLAAKPDSMSSVSTTYVVEGENQLSHCPLTSTFGLWHT